MQPQTIVAIAKVAHNNPMDAFRNSHMGKALKAPKPKRTTKSTRKT